ncbi:MAG: hypothetical protein JNK64_19710 [Myxococcales bacterium]|nr:hypothetical protein [Myxococcales bacterium]
MTRQLALCVALALVGCQKTGGGGGGPPADCDKVGPAAAAFELGNYAPPETRAPTVARFVKACRDTGVDAKQGECLMTAKDVWSAALCAPKMFPDVKVDGQCDVVAAKLRDAIAKQFGGGAGAPPEMAKLPERAATAIKDSCNQDGWPPAMKACLANATDPLQDWKGCEHLASPELTSKLQARMTSAMGGR